MNGLRDLPRELPAHPEWDVDARQFRVGPKLLKQFVRAAPLLERILQELHESNWSHEIEDPLPGGLSPEAAKRRLHDAINDLNACQAPQLVRFFGNGTGEALRWAYTPEFLALYAC